MLPRYSGIMTAMSGVSMEPMVDRVAMSDTDLKAFGAESSQL